MIFYAVLTLATLVIVALSFAVWWKTRQVGFLIGFGFLYYWSLYGGWLVISRGVGYGKNYRFEYLYYKLFPVYLDAYYLWALILYALFVITIQIVVLHTASHRIRATVHPAVPIFVSHAKLLTLAAVMALGAYMIVRNMIAMALSSDGSAYGSVQQVPFFSIYQILHESAVTLAMAGLVVFASGSRARYIRGESRLPVLVGYIVVLSGIVSLNVLLGNRSMLAFAIAGAGLFYLVNAERPSGVLLSAGVACAVAGMLVIGIIRGAGGQRELGDLNFIGKLQYVVADGLSQDVEAFAAHASLYGTLQKHVPITYGSSVALLAFSLLPRFIRPALVADSYAHYAWHVGASPNQGFTLHHATGWYVNFGVPGVIFGGAIFGWIWATLFNMFGTVSSDMSYPGQVFATLGFWNVTAYIPMVIRSGPEVYKAVLFESLLIPSLLMLAASTTLVMRANRPRLIPVDGSRHRGRGPRHA
jgi:hypothetical protein